MRCYDLYPHSERLSGLPRRVNGSAPAILRDSAVTEGFYHPVILTEG